MLYVNDDNDDLFRKAAADYPLNTGTPDWEQLNKKMQEAGNSQNQEKKTKKRSYAWLVLLPLLFASLPIFDNSLLKATRTASANTQPNSNSLPGSNTANPISEEALANNRSNISVTYPNRAGITAGQTTGLLNPPDHLPKTTYSASSMHKQVKKTTPIENKDLIASHEEPNSAPIVSAENVKKTIPKESNTAVMPPLPKDSIADKKLPEQKTIIDKAVAKKDTPKKRAPGKHFYIGLMGGPDISMVKLQTVKNVGFNIGLLAGYRLMHNLVLRPGFIGYRHIIPATGRISIQRAYPSLPISP